MRRKNRSTPPASPIAERVVAILLARDIDQKELAARIGVSEGYLSRILNGARVWTVSLILRTAAALDVSIGDLDPALGKEMLANLVNVELQGDQIRVAFAAVKWLPHIHDVDDLRALACVIEAFGRKRPC